jgi:hypothetical protein
VHQHLFWLFASCAVLFYVILIWFSHQHLLWLFHLQLVSLWRLLSFASASVLALRLQQSLFFLFSNLALASECFGFQASMLFFASVAFGFASAVLISSASALPIRCFCISFVFFRF